MATIDLNALPNDAKTWIFGISPQLNDAAAADVLESVESFIVSWTSHGDEITGAAQLVEGSFLIVAITPQSETSGCSIDKMFGVLRSLERKHGVSIIDSDRVFYRDEARAIRAVPRFEFRTVASAETVVFDTSAERLASVRNGAWERSASDSWHAQLL